MEQPDPTEIEQDQSSRAAKDSEPKATGFKAPDSEQTTATEQPTPEPEASAMDIDTEQTEATQATKDSKPTMPAPDQATNTKESALEQVQPISMEVEVDQGQSSKAKVDLDMPTSSSMEAPTPSSSDDWDEELFQNISECFYAALKNYMAFALRKPKASFGTFQNILQFNLNSIEQACGAEKSQPFKQLLEEAEKDVKNWRDLNILDVKVLAEQESATLVAQSQEKQLLMEAKLHSIQGKIAELQASRSKVEEDMELANSVLSNATQQQLTFQASMKKAQDEIQRAQARYNKAQTLFEEASQKIKATNDELKQIDDRNTSLQISEHQQREKAEAIEKELAEVKKVAAEELRLQAIARAEEKKRQDLLVLADKLKFYTEHKL